MNLNNFWAKASVKSFISFAIFCNLLFVRAEGAVADLSELKVGIHYHPPYFREWLNENLQDDDFVGIIHLSVVESLRAITPGFKGVRSPCASTLISSYQRYADIVDYIGYNIEHWPQTPDSEQLDPVGTVRRLKEFADSHNLMLTVGPDRRFDDQYGAAMAQFADNYVLQLQAYMQNPDTFAAQAIRRTARLRAANPQIRVFAQVSVSRDVPIDTIFRCIQLVVDSVDGVWIFYRAPTDDTLRVAELYEMIRPQSVMDESQRRPLQMENLDVQVIRNPSNGRFVFKLRSNRAEPVNLTIYDVGGRMIRRIGCPRTGSEECTLEWDGLTEDGKIAKSGIYIAKFVQGDHTEFVRLLVFSAARSK